MQICLGCGASYEREPGHCVHCFEKLRRCLDVYGHWPMELALSVAAMREVWVAIYTYLKNNPGGDKQVRSELTNTLSHIRSYLQHVAEGLRPYKEPPREAEPTDEELLR